MHHAKGSVLLNNYASTKLGFKEIERVL